MFGNGPEEIQEKNDRMRSLMEAENLPYNDRSHTYNSRLSQELGIWAVETQPADAEAYNMAVYKAYFVDNKNVGEQEVLLDLAKISGLNAKAAKDVLENRTYKDKVDLDWNKSRKYGVTGVPTFVAGGKGCVGAQPYEAISSMLESVGAKKKEG